MSYWIQWQRRLCLPLLAENFTPDVQAECNQLIALESEKMPADAVKTLPNFTEGLKWKPFKAAMISYFNSIYSCKHWIPIAYVIREYEDPDPDMEYKSKHKALIATMSLAGLEFKEDNGQVYDYLNSWILGGPSHAWMREYCRTRNGRAAWLALIQQHEETAQQDQIKLAAYSAIANARYRGPRRAIHSKSTSPHIRMPIKT